jgi:hypothetical protein
MLPKYNILLRFSAQSNEFYKQNIQQKMQKHTKGDTENHIEVKRNIEELVPICLFKSKAEKKAIQETDFYLFIQSKRQQKRRVKCVATK